jgi:hypothetical protein
MEICNAMKGFGGRLGIYALVLGLAASVSTAAPTSAPVATLPYTVKVFAQVPQGISQPDSIVL